MVRHVILLFAITNGRSRTFASSIRCSAAARGGISLGVNLNPDKVCNFDCIYCQVDRTTAEPKPRLSKPIDCSTNWKSACD